MDEDDEADTYTTPCFCPSYYDIEAAVLAEVCPQHGTEDNR